MRDMTIERVLPVGPREFACVVSSFSVSNRDTASVSPNARAKRNGLTVTYKAVSYNMWCFSELEKMSQLTEGWDGYGAPAPSGAAIAVARSYLGTLFKERLEPSRVAPSVVGGIGITHKLTKRRVYVECFNDGQIYALFSDGQSLPNSRPVKAREDSFEELIGAIRDYLNA